MLSERLSAFALIAVTSTALAACSSSSTPAAAPPPTVEAGPADAGAEAAAAPTFPMQVNLALTADASGEIALSAVQGKQSVAASTVIGKHAYGIIFPEGSQPGNDTPIAPPADAVLGQDLKAVLQFPPMFKDGYYELALVISISGWTPAPGSGSPSPEDLGAFTDPTTAPPPPDGVPYTGQTIRVQVNNGAAVINVDGSMFIALGGPSQGDAGGEGGH